MAAGVVAVAGSVARLRVALAPVEVRLAAEVAVKGMAGLATVRWAVELWVGAPLEVEVVAAVAMVAGVQEAVGRAATVAGEPVGEARAVSTVGGEARAEGG